MRVDLLIDGYNLLHAAGLAKQRYAPGDLHRRRARLLQKLSDLLDPAVLARATVVFDARRDPPLEPTPEPPRAMTVLFAHPHHEADDVIEELLAKHSVPKRVLVVSSDHRLQRAARRRGASAIGSDEFLERLEDDVERWPEFRGPALSTPRPTSDSGDLQSELQAAAEAELRKLEAEPPGADAAPDPRPMPPSPVIDEIQDPAFWERRLREDRGTERKGRRPRRSE